MLIIPLIPISYPFTTLFFVATDEGLTFFEVTLALLLNPAETNLGNLRVMSLSAGVYRPFVVTADIVLLFVKALELFLFYGI